MITVAHIITRLELGGAQQNTIDTCVGLDRKRFRVRLLYGPGGPLDDRLDELAAHEKRSIAHLGRAIAPSDDLRAFLEIRGDLEALGPCLVHTHSSKAGILGRAAARSLGLRGVIHSIHGFGFHAEQPRWKRAAFVTAERQAARWTRAFLSVSRANLAEAQARGIVGPQHLARILRSGMNLEPFVDADARRSEARLALSAPAGPLFLSVANLKPQKAPLDLVRAFQLVKVERPDAELWFVGDGPLRGEVEAELRARGLDGFRLLGWRRDVPSLMAACDVVVLSSIFEGLPRTAVQAVRARRPFVGTRVDGTAEVIEDGVNGFLVEPRAPQQLAQAMLRALLERPIDPSPEIRCRPWSVQALIHGQEALYEEVAATT
ncbi:MAG: glycosyltransferase [Myxococcota bacterium]